MVCVYTNKFYTHGAINLTFLLHVYKTCQCKHTLFTFPVTQKLCSSNFLLSSFLSLSNILSVSFHPAHKIQWLKMEVLRILWERKRDWPRPTQIHNRGEGGQGGCGFFPKYLTLKKMFWNPPRTGYYRVAASKKQCHHYIAHCIALTDITFVQHILHR